MDANQLYLFLQTQKEIDRDSALPSRSWYSEAEFRAQLDYAIAVSHWTALISSTCDASKGRGRKAHAGIAEVRSIRDAESFSPEFDAHLFPNRDMAEKRRIQVEQSRPSELKAPHVSQNSVSHDWTIGVGCVRSGLGLAKR